VGGGGVSVNESVNLYLQAGDIRRFVGQYVMSIIQACHAVHRMRKTTYASISRKRYEIRSKLLLMTNRKLHVHFRLASR